MEMNRLIIIYLFFLFALGINAQSKTHVKSYTKKNGTHIASHNRTNKDHTEKNNWSSKPNTNPETGKKGHKRPKN